MYYFFLFTFFITFSMKFFVIFLDKYNFCVMFLVSMDIFNIYHAYWLVFYATITIPNTNITESKNPRPPVSNFKLKYLNQNVEISAQNLASRFHNNYKTEKRKE